MSKTEKNNNCNEYVVKIEFPQVINAALTPISQAIGETIANGWKGMTMSVDTWLGRKEIDKEINLKLYKEAIQKNLNKIDENNLQKPSMNILCPSLDASKYYFEEEQYREMFSKLIASSCDKSKNQYTHPAFVEFIKQMQPLDGKILRDLDMSNLFLINIIDLSNNNRTRVGFMPSVVNSYEATIYEFNTSLTNLSRLGLIELPVLSSLVITDEQQKLIKNSKLYDSIIESISSDLPANYDTVIFPLEITNMGKNFIKVCII